MYPTSITTTIIDNVLGISSDTILCLVGVLISFVVSVLTSVVVCMCTVISRFFDE